MRRKIELQPVREYLHNWADMQMNGRRIVPTIVVLALFSAGVEVPLLADTPTASIMGTIKDASGSVLADVAVSAKSIDTDVTRSTTTNQAGNYLFLGLGAGSYEVSASRSGFTTARRMGLVLRVSDEVRIDLSLTVGEARESVSVTAAAPLVQTESGTVSAVVNKQAIQELPNDGRQLQNLALIVPGVSGGWNLSGCKPIRQGPRKHGRGVQCERGA